MDDRRLADLARKQGGVVTTRQIMRCGLSRAGINHRVGTDRLFPIRRGAFTLGPVQDATAHHWAAILTTEPDHAMLSHWSAGLVHGFSSVRPSAIHVTLPGVGGRVVPGLAVHRSRSIGPADVVVVDGLRVTSPPRTVLDIAGRADDRTTYALIREAEFRRMLRAGAMLDLVRANPRHPGAARIRRVDPMTIEASLGQTPLEDQLEALISTLPLPAFDRQVALVGASGATYSVDFGWRHLRLAVEGDSRSAHERSTSFESDRFRDNDLAATGWLTLRFTRIQIERRRSDVARQIVATAASRDRDADRR